MLCRWLKKWIRSRHPLWKIRCCQAHVIRKCLPYPHQRKRRTDILFRWLMFPSKFHKFARLSQVRICKQSDLCSSVFKQDMERMAFECTDHGRTMSFSCANSPSSLYWLRHFRNLSRRVGEDQRLSRKTIHFRYASAALENSGCIQEEYPTTFEEHGHTWQEIWTCGVVLKLHENGSTQSLLCKPAASP